MSCRQSDYGTFYHPSVLATKIKEKVLEAHSERDYPVIYDVFAQNWTLSVCVYQKQILALCSRGDVDPTQDFTLKKARDKHLYFILMYLHSCREPVQALLPFLSEYDVIKLIQNREYFILRSYLKFETKKKEIPPPALQDPRALKMFVDAGWPLSLRVTYQYYAICIHELYRLSVLYILEKWNFEEDEEHKEALEKFLDCARKREDEQVIELLEKHI